MSTAFTIVRIFLLASLVKMSTIKGIEIPIISRPGQLEKELTSIKQAKLSDFGLTSVSPILSHEGL